MTVDDLYEQILDDLKKREQFVKQHLGYSDGYLSSFKKRPELTIAALQVHLDELLHTVELGYTTGVYQDMVEDIIKSYELWKIAKEQGMDAAMVHKLSRS